MWTSRREDGLAEVSSDGGGGLTGIPAPAHKLERIPRKKGVPLHMYDWQKNYHNYFRQ